MTPKSLAGRCESRIQLKGESGNRDNSPPDPLDPADDGGSGVSPSQIFYNV